MNDPTYQQAEIEANPEWHIAWLLSEMRNDNAPIGWGAYLPDARLILQHYEVERKPGTPVEEREP